MMPQNDKIHIPSLLQLLLSGLGLLFCLPAVPLLFLTGLVVFWQAPTSGAESYAFFALGWTTLTIGLLVLPSAVLALLRLLQPQRYAPPEPVAGGISSTGSASVAARKEHQAPGAQRLSQRLSISLMILWFPLLLAGQSVARGEFAWLFLPPIQVLVIGIPLWWLVEAGSHGLPALSARRRWGLVSLSMLFTPVLILAAEILLLGVLALAVGAWLTTQPAMAETLSRLGMRLMNSDLDPEVLARIFRPLLRRPEVIFGILTVAAGLIPLLEEALKPIGLWALSLKPLKPAEGFTAGLTCGAAFAFLESSGMLSAPFGELWGVMAMARLGTGLLHTACSGLVGWGLANGWYNRGYLRMVLAFLLAAAFHAIWNMFSLMVGMVTLLPANGLAQTLAIIAPVVLGLLMIILFVFVIGANRLLRK